MIVVVGESLVDLIVGPSSEMTAVAGGGPSNTARTLARLGSEVSFVSRLSTDRFGRDARALLEAEGVRLDLAESTDDPTTLAVAEIDADGVATYHFYTAGTAAPGLSAAAVGAILAVPPTAVHIGTLGLVLEPLADTIDALVARLDPATLLMLDVNARPTATPDLDAYRARVARLLGRADVVKVSVDDLAFAYPDSDATAALDRVASAGPAAVLCTDGARPVIVAVDGERRSVEVPSVQVVDTVGAGDAFGGGFLHAWTRGGFGRDGLRDIEAVVAAAAFAARVAALTVGRPGGDPPFAIELGLSG